MLAEFDQMSPKFSSCVPVGWQLMSSSGPAFFKLDVDDIAIKARKILDRRGMVRIEAKPFKIRTETFDSHCIWNE